MSVSGEYRRILGDLQSALAEGSPDAARFGRSLREAEIERCASVSAAAERALALCEEAPIGDAVLREGESARELLDHFTKLCRIVLGR